MAASNLISILIEAKDNATAALSAVGSEVNSLGSSAEKSAESGNILSDTMGGFGRTLLQVGAAFVAYQIIGSIESMGTAAITASAGLEQTNMSFQSLIGNTQQANKLFGQLVQYANVTPFQAAQVTDAAKQLLAFGQTASQVTTTVKQLGDVASAGGGDLQALALVTGQIFAQGKLRAQDMYQVINDGGAGLVKIMAQSAGGMQALTDEFNTGGIPAQQYFDAINQATAQGGFAFQGADKQAQTFNGRLSTLKDSATQFGEALLGVHTDPELGLEIQPGGLFDRMRNGIQDVSTALQGWEPAVQRSVPTFLTDIGHLASVVSTALGPPLEALANTLATRLGPSLERLMPTLKLMAEVLGVTLIAAIWALVNVLNILISVLSYLAQVIENVANWFVHAWNDVIVPTWGVAINFFKAIGSGIADEMSLVESYIVQPFANAYDTVIGIFENLPHDIESVISGAFADVGGVVKSVFHTLHIPGFAMGTQFAPGGTSVVGENGPELVDLPQGAKVTPARQTNQALQHGPGGASIANLTVNNYTQVDMRRMLRNIGFQLAVAG